MSTTTRERAVNLRDAEVRTLLDKGVVTIRRPAKAYPALYSSTGWVVKLPGGRMIETDDRSIPYCPFGAPGDRLWGREAYAPRYGIDPQKEPKRARRHALYRANGASLHDLRYPARWAMCPRWASRLALVNGGVRVDRADDGTWEWVVTLRKAGEGTT